MSVNIPYLSNLNKVTSQSKQKLSNMLSFISGKSDIIQIGVGGYSSSGKTVLIDAIFSLFSDAAIPEYMPKTHVGTFLNASDRLSAYSTHSDLRADVSISFHGDHATVDEGIWHENTHCAKLHFGNTEKILLIRNIPGEMFSDYFAKLGNDNKSLKSRFQTFIAENKEYKKIYKKLFKFEIEKGNPKQKELIEESITKLREAFFKSIKLETLVAGEGIRTIQRNFFAFLFYMTSDYNVYCIKSKGLADEEIKIAADNIFRANSEKSEFAKFIICFTQFDRILNANTLPEINHSNNGELESPQINFWKRVKNSFAEKKQETINTTMIADTEIKRYWLTMNEYYSQIESNKFDLLNETDWKNLKKITGNIRYSWFYTSVAYNYSEKKFLGFQNQGTQTNVDVWSLQNNNERTPIGVLELLLYILRKNGCHENNWQLGLEAHPKFKTIRRKIGIE